jgi:thiamine-phosphate pyrophosphorylase
MKTALFRIIDANYNRLKEGLRVCEDVIRYAFEDESLTRNYKTLRHSVTSAFKKLSLKEINLFESRDSMRDVGRKTPRYELNKKNIRDLFLANLQRAKESARVLEEVSKLINKKAALQFKDIRYKLYELEKKTFKKIKSLHNRR